MVALAHEANCQRAQKSHHDESESGLEETGLSGQLLVVAIYRLKKLGQHLSTARTPSAFESTASLSRSCPSIRACARGTSMSSIACSSLSFVPDSVGAPRAVPSLRLRSHIESKGEATWATGPRRDGDSAFRKLTVTNQPRKQNVFGKGLQLDGR